MRAVNDQVTPTPITPKLINTIFDAVGSDHLEIKRDAMDFNTFAVLYRNLRLFNHYAEAEEDVLTAAEFGKLLEDMEFDEVLFDTVGTTLITEQK